MACITRSLVLITTHVLLGMGKTCEIPNSIPVTTNNFAIRDLEVTASSRVIRLVTVAFCLLQLLDFCSRLRELLLEGNCCPTVRRIDFAVL